MDSLPPPTIIAVIATNEVLVAANFEGRSSRRSVIELCFGGHRDRWGIAHNGRSDRNYWFRDHLRRIRLDGYHRRNHWRRGHHGSLAGVG